MVVPENKIDIINLEHKTIRSIVHQYTWEDVAQFSLVTFSDTRLFTVQERGTSNDHRLKLNYYQYESTENAETCSPVSTYESKDNEWNYEFPVKKGNNHSMIIWFKQKHEG